MKDKADSKERPAGESKQKASARSHPSRSLGPRARGYGIGGGYEKPYRERTRPVGHHRESYGPVPHAGYYGVGAGQERFGRGHASFDAELCWYRAQYGENTSKRPKQQG